MRNRLDLILYHYRTSAQVEKQAIGYDAARQIVYWAQPFADDGNPNTLDEMPVIHAFSLRLKGGRAGRAR